MHSRCHDEKRWRACIFGILSPGADKPRARDKAKVNMYKTTKTHIRNLMSGLAQTQPRVLDYPVQELAASRWMSESCDHFTVQLNYCIIAIRQYCIAVWPVMVAVHWKHHFWQC